MVILVLTLELELVPAFFPGARGGMRWINGVVDVFPVAGVVPVPVAVEIEDEVDGEGDDILKVAGKDDASTFG